MVADHEHVEVLVERVSRIRPRGVRGAREDVFLAHDADDVRCVAAARALGVICVDCSALERGKRAFDKAGLVEGIGVNQTLDVELVADGETGVNGGRGGSPVLVELETARARIDLLPERDGEAVVALACDADVERERVACLEHLAHVVLAGRARRRAGSGAGTIRLVLPFRTGSYLGPVPPPNMVVMPDATDSYAC